jgi:hypothetical protein
MNGATDHREQAALPHHRSDAADRILLECPACGASEMADPAVLCDAPTIVCRNCGETWPSAEKRRRRVLPPAPSTSATDVVDAERRPLVTFSDGAEKAWARKIEGDVLPEQAPEPRRAALSAAATAAVLFLAAFVAARESAVAALPDLAGLYAAIGMPVNLDGLSIEGVTARRKSADDPDTLVVVGTIRNIGGSIRSVPPLLAHFPAAEGASERGGLLAGTADDLAPGEQVSFEFKIAGAPERAEEVELRFARPSEAASGG